MKHMNHGLRRKTLLLSVIALGMLLLCFGGQYAEAQAKKAKVRKHTCAGCHRMPASGITAANPFPQGMEASSLCLDCHHYETNHHPVEFISRYTDPAGVSLNSFPLFDGEVRCLTCHEVHGAGGAKMLRGGPYASSNEICFRCHENDLNTKFDPHIMLDNDGFIREVNGTPVCLFCHVNVPDQSRTDMEITFRADVAFLCWRCHPPMEGDFFKGHFLVKPKKATLDIIRATEGSSGVMLPLLNRDRITCSTCHNPHQEGVIQSRPASAGAGVTGRLRLSKEKLCSGCHSR